MSENVLAAIYCPQDGVADHTATTQAMATAARAHGVSILEHAPVTSLTRKDGRVVTLGAIVDNKHIEIPVGEQVTLLSNAHIASFVRQQLGLELPIWRMLPQVMALEAQVPPPMQHLIGHAHRTLAIKPLPDGRVMISGGWRGRWNKATNQGEPIAQQVEGNRQEAIAVYPSLADLPVAEVYTDRIETLSIDGIPIIDYLPGTSNLLLGVGWSGHGWAIAPAVAKLMATWLLNGSRPSLLAPFRYSPLRSSRLKLRLLNNRHRIFPAQKIKIDTKRRLIDMPQI